MKQLFLVFWWLVAGLVPSVVEATGRFEALAAFQAAGTGPEGGLVAYPDGFLYGTTRSGGAFGHGTLFRIGRAAGSQMEVLVHFTGVTGNARGRRPQAALFDSGDGSLWGTTVQGGQGNQPDGFGTVFRFQPVTRDFVSVIQFTGSSGFSKGSFPQGALEKDSAGRIWGTTSAGGSSGNGTVFRIDPVTQSLTTVTEFTGNGGLRRGRSPFAGLFYDGNGTLWGTTAEGGADSGGTFFRLDAATGTFLTVFDFTGSSGAYPGSRPLASVRKALDGSLWGSTANGGANSQGTVFRYDPVGNGYSVVIHFTGSTGEFPGRQPALALSMNQAGFVFGTTNGGGIGDFGTAFRINAATRAYTLLGTFTGNGGDLPGTVPSSALAVDADGQMYGTTSAGGSARLGTVFRVQPADGKVQSLASLTRTVAPATASTPLAGLTSAADGWLYGTSSRGGRWNAGTLFRIQPGSSVPESLVEFSGTGGDHPGAEPAAELLWDPASGTLWGTTLAGGNGDMGTVFSWKPATRTFAVMGHFTGLNGRNPNGRLLRDSQGRLWGTAGEGGTEFNGTVFRIQPTGGEIVTVVNFSGSGGDFPGDGPVAGLTSDEAGYLWGSTYEGGENNQGTLFRIQESSGAFSHVLSFTGSEGLTMGAGPSAAMTLHPSGQLWGSTAFGGPDDAGTVFRIDRTTLTYATVVKFTGSMGDVLGRSPRSGLVLNPSGDWYGVTETGGTSDQGTVYRISPADLHSLVLEFSGAAGVHPGEKPRGTFQIHSDGHFYGTTSAGGSTGAQNPAGNGQLFRLFFGPEVVTGSVPEKDSTTAILQGSVNPNGAAGTVGFEVGTHPQLVDAVLIPVGTFEAVTTPQPLTLPVAQLQPATTYYYRIRAQNAENLVPQRGAILSFTTAPATGGTDSFTKWAADAGLSGGAQAAGQDADGDGVANALEYVLGGNPASAEAGGASLPILTESPQGLQFRFGRIDASETPDVALSVELDNGLDLWADGRSIGATTATSSEGITVEENGALPDTIIVTVPRVAARQFMRIKIRILP